MAAQREFAEEEEDEARDRKRKIGKVLAGVGAVGAGAGAAKTLYDAYENETHFDKRINDLVTDNQERYSKRISEANDAAKELKDRAHIKFTKDIEGNFRHPDYEKFKQLRDEAIYDIDSNLKKEVKGIEEKFGYNATQDKIKKLKGEADFNRGKIIRSGAFKYGLPALAVTSVGAGMMYKNRKKKDKE